MGEANEPSLKAAQREGGREGGRESSVLNMEAEHLFHGKFFAEETRRAVTLTPDLLLVERVLP